MDISIGKYKVFQTGTVISLPNESVIFDFQALRFIFTFIDTEDKIQKIETKIDGRTSLELKFYNFNNVLGTGNTTPLPLGTLNGAELLLQFRIFSLGDGSNSNTGKTIHYTWLLNQVSKAEEPPKTSADE